MSPYKPLKLNDTLRFSLLSEDEWSKLFICQIPFQYGMLHGMNTVVQIDQAGRVVLPKRLRERFRLKGGDSLTLEVKGDAIELRPQQASLRLQRVNGVLVIKGEKDISDTVVSEARDERINEIARQATNRE